ncbi:MAG: phosphatidylserine decarboxylase [bacterium]|nr:phosphatidylserine decarboxylase [bacterium]
MIPIAKEGYIFILPLIVLTIGVWFLKKPVAFWPVLILTLFVISFFRDPSRNIVRDANTVYSPADGLVTQIKDVEWEGAPHYQIVIFLSVFNCHVNRIPYAGTVRSTEHKPGLMLAAFRKDIDEKNEQQITIIDTDKGPMKVVQITGAIARRILCHLTPGQTVATGERFGLIRFGSRTDLYLPKSAHILVKEKQSVKGGLTKIATL